jgi:hypothetical protein
MFIEQVSRISCNICTSKEHINLVIHVIKHPITIRKGTRALRKLNLFKEKEKENEKEKNLVGGALTLLVLCEAKDYA